MTALVLEETVPGRRIAYLIWRSLAGLSDLLPVKLEKGAENALEKVGS